MLSAVGTIAFRLCRPRGFSSLSHGGSLLLSGPAFRQSLSALATRLLLLAFLVSVIGDNNAFITAN